MNFWRYRKALLIVGFIAVFFLLGLVKRAFSVTPMLHIENKSAYNVHHDVFCTSVVSDHLGCCGSSWTWPYIQSFDLISGESYDFTVQDIGWCLFDAYVYGGSMVNIPCHAFFSSGVSCSSEWTTGGYSFVLPFMPESLRWRTQLFNPQTSNYISSASPWVFINIYYSAYYNIYSENLYRVNFSDIYFRADGKLAPGTGKTENGNSKKTRGVGLYESFH